MKDIAGNPLALGDMVATTAPGRNEMILGEVIKFTPKGVKVKRQVKNWRGDLIDEEIFRPNALVCKAIIA